MLESLTAENRAVAGRRCRWDRRVIDGGVEICHGAPFDEDAYIFDELDARHAFDAAHRAGLLLRPHALRRRVPACRATRSTSSVRQANGETSAARSNRRREVSGESRVGRSAARRRSARRLRASSTPTTQRVDLIRLPYPLEVTQEKMLKAGLPEPLARRLRWTLARLARDLVADDAAVSVFGRMTRLPDSLPAQPAPALPAASPPSPPAA